MPFFTLNKVASQSLKLQPAHAFERQKIRKMESVTARFFRAGHHLKDESEKAL